MSEHYYLPFWFFWLCLWGCFVSGVVAEKLAARRRRRARRLEMESRVNVIRPRVVAWKQQEDDNNG